jgi:transcription antitermination factor NusB
VKKRTRARELALQFLYQLDLRGEEALEHQDEFLRGEESDRSTTDFAAHLVEGTVEHLPEINQIIRGVAQNWDIERMAVIDRNVLRLATFELLWCPDIPPKVSINEAIELGKRFSTQNSGGFINGILDRIKDGHVGKGGVADKAPEKAPEKAPDSAPGADSGEDA